MLQMPVRWSTLGIRQRRENGRKLMEFLASTGAIRYRNDATGNKVGVNAIRAQECLKIFNCVGTHMTDDLGAAYQPVGVEAEILKALEWLAQGIHPEEYSREGFIAKIEQQVLSLSLSLSLSLF